MRKTSLFYTLLIPLLLSPAAVFALEHWNGKVSTVFIDHTGAMQLLMQSINTPSPKTTRWRCPNNTVLIPKNTDETARSLFYSTAVIAYKESLEVRFGIVGNSAEKPSCRLRYMSLKPR